MSDEGEKTCPLCAEEMDLTDKQLKPCKCGYEICVWCWHHIMDMAEKDDSEGRCPACRVPYDKEKIVGMAASCEKVVTAGKTKSQKTKSKSSEGRKQLSSVRVIQRNLVYIVGLPLNLADEDLLQRKEYFGQYGKVLKVSMSRTASGVIQQFPNNTCSVYITYGKEEEAVRCIQSVHGFILDGRSLRACFGTTKYCHAWLRNVPCSNPDCLYLHEIGSQEDSYTKDEIISAYTRSRVQQITGATLNMQRRSGNVLPAPTDDFCISSSATTGRPIVKNASNNSVSIVKGSPPNSSSGRSPALPAAASWGMRASNCQTPAASSASSKDPSKPKLDTFSGSLAYSSAVANSIQASNLHSDVEKKLISNEESQGKGKEDSLEPIKQHIGTDSQTAASEKLVTVNGASASSCQLASIDKDRGTILPPKITVSSDLMGRPKKEGNLASEGKTGYSHPETSIDSNLRNEPSGGVRPNSSHSDHISIKSPGNQGLQQHYADQIREPLVSAAVGNPVASSREQLDWRSDSHSHILPTASAEVEEDLRSFNDQRLNDPEFTYLPNPANSLRISNHSREHSLHHTGSYNALKLNADQPPFVNRIPRDGLRPQASSFSGLSNGYPENFVSSLGSDRSVEHSYFLPNEEKGKQMGRFTANSGRSAGTDTGESSIISNILSLDLDSWDDSLTSPQDLARLLGENDNQQHVPQKISNSWKVQNNNQSRFSFARQEEPQNQVFDIEPSYKSFGQMGKNRFVGQDFIENRNQSSVINQFSGKNGNGFAPSNFEEFDNFASSQSVFPSNKFSVSRSQISAPPGFSVPNRTPPGFSSQERMEQAYDTTTGSHMLDGSSLFRNSFQASQTGNINSTGDIEFIDPAILAVGKGRLPSGLNNSGLDMRLNYPQQLNSYENEARLQLLLQRSLSQQQQQQNLRYNDIGDCYSPLNDTYGIHSRLMEQSQANNISPYAAAAAAAAAAQLSLHQQSRNNAALMSNGHWDGSHQNGNHIGMVDLLRNERMGYNKFYNGYEESKFRMPSSGDLYNRTFGM